MRDKELVLMKKYMEFPPISSILIKSIDQMIKNETRKVNCKIRNSFFPILVVSTVRPCDTLSNVLLKHSVQ
jgi:hypothetical protein